MIYTKMTKKAIEICFDAHKDQKDKSGLPYVFHPFHLAEQMKTEETIIVALLHDIIEDAGYTAECLLEEGFSKEVVDALLLLTHDDKVKYLDYVKKIKPNPIARAVKIADLQHNSDLSRLDIVDEKAIKRYNKYNEALEFLLK